MWLSSNVKGEFVRNAHAAPKRTLERPSWTAADNSLSSLENTPAPLPRSLMRPTRSRRSLRNERPAAPVDSTARATKSTRSSKAEYLAHFWASTSSATAPFLLDADAACEGARGFHQVASQKSARPLENGRTVTRSGRLPSLLESPGGSIITGTPAGTKAPCTNSLIMRWLICLPRPCPHMKAWNPKESRASTRAKRDAAAKGSSKRKRTVHVNAGPSSRVRSLEEGAPLRKAPASSQVRQLKRNDVIDSGKLSVIYWYRFFNAATTHLLCEFTASASSTSTQVTVFHIANVESTRWTNWTRSKSRILTI